MKRIIKGKKYDTETATKLGYACSNASRNDFSFWEEELYRKKTGEYFMYAFGGPATGYAELCGNNCWKSGERIYPLTIEKAKEWAERYLDVDEYEEIFGEVEE